MNIASPTPYVVAPEDVGQPCMISPQGGIAVSVYLTPSSSASALIQAEPGSSNPVLAALADRSWYLVEVQGVIGWVANFQIEVDGDCSAVRIVGANGSANASTSSAGTATPIPAVPTGLFDAATEESTGEEE